MNDRFSSLDTETFCFLNRTLAFNPFFRISVHDALDHPFLSSVRSSKMEVSSQEVDLVFDHSENPLTADDLRVILLTEINLVKGKHL
jgi:hypothetical protein